MILGSNTSSSCSRSTSIRLLSLSGTSKILMIIDSTRVMEDCSDLVLEYVVRVCVKCVAVLWAVV